MFRPLNEDNLSIRNKSHAPKLSPIWRFHCRTKHSSFDMVNKFFTILLWMPKQGSLKCVCVDWWNIRVRRYNSKEMPVLSSTQPSPKCSMCYYYYLLHFVSQGLQTFLIPLFPSAAAHCKYFIFQHSIRVSCVMCDMVVCLTHLLPGN